MSLIKLKGPLLVVLLAALPAEVTSAQNTFFDSFNYSAGSLSGQSGGGSTGFSAPWTISGGPVNVSSTGLSTYSGSAGYVDAAGGSASLSGNNYGAFRSLDTTYGTNGSAIWVSFLMDPSNTSGYLGLSLFNGSTEELFVGIDDTTGKLGMVPWTQSSGPRITTGISAVAGQSDLFDVEIIPGGGVNSSYSTINVWINNTANLDLGGVSPNASTTLAANFMFNSIRVQGGDTSTGGLIDEIRGSDGGYEDMLNEVVAPVPEPSAFALSGVGALALTFASRRKKPSKPLP